MGFNVIKEISNTKIVQDFKESLNQILGLGDPLKGPNTKFDPTVGGPFDLKPENWVGNTTAGVGTRNRRFRYGFASMSDNDIKNGNKVVPIHYLQIPPQSITQKELFANNITATRRGIIVESEGVVFKDIIIQGTTGVFPGVRGGSNVPQAASFNPFSEKARQSGPTAPSGVDTDLGVSKNSTDTTISGYEEFMTLRQFFLEYANTKILDNGNRFLIFINEKDSQEIIVEPMEFTMDRSSKSPMVYNYKIVLKAIGTLAGILQRKDPKDENEPLGLLEQISNVSANLTATIQQGRAVIGASQRLLQGFTQAIDTTFNGPLRQVQFAAEDLSDGVATVLSLPEILTRNATETVLSVRESIDDISNAFATSPNFAQAISDQGDRLAEQRRAKQIVDGDVRLENAATFQEQKAIAEKIETDSRIPIPRSFINTLKGTTNELADNLADFINLGDPLYDSIKGRIVTNPPAPLKVASDEEFLLLGTLLKISNEFNNSLASNIMFQSDAEEAFERATELFRIPDIPEDQQVKIQKPSSVREIFIERNDTLERIAQRELGDALKWIDLIVLNNLKPPYISVDGGDGVKKPGERLLIGSNVGGGASTEGNGTIRGAEFPITASLTEAEKQLGVDLQLTKNNDLDLDNLQDFKLTSGGANLGQAVKIRLGIEPRGLQYHPNIGTDLQIGEKVKSAFLIKTQILRSLSSDPRLESVDVNVTVLGSIVIIDIRIEPKNTGVEVPLKFVTLAA